MKNTGYNHREDKDGEYLMYGILGILFFGLLGYFLATKLDWSWLGYAEKEKQSTVVLGGVLSESGEYVNAFGEKIGEFFSFTLPNSVKVNIPKGGLEDKFLNNLNNSSFFSKKVVFDRLYYATGSAAISENSDDQIESMIKILKAFSNVSVLLRGHTDNTGSNEVNKVLSLSRALKLKEKFVYEGIEESRISVEGVGSNEPLESNSRSQGRFKNRRVDISILKKQQVLENE